MAETIKILVVDDSLLMRKVISEILGEIPGIEVVGVAMDGDFALMKLARLSVDVVILDINMPRMDGLSVLKVIAEQFHIPTIVLSAYTREGAYLTMQALSYGAADFICKPDEGSLTQNRIALRNNLLEKIKIAHQITLKQGKHRPTKTGRFVPNSLPRPDAELPANDGHLTTKRRIYSPPEQVAVTAGRTSQRIEMLYPKPVEETKPEEFVNLALANLPKLIAIGASTGGTAAVEKILAALPSDFPAAVVVAQHMPKEFTPVFAETLNQHTKLQVTEAYDGQLLMPGAVYIAPGDCHMLVKRVNAQYQIALDRLGEPVNGLCPSVDILFHSVALAAGKKAFGIVLTGMGKDGAVGIESIKKAGGHTIAQDEESCVVFGMPKEAIKTGAIDMILPLANIHSWLIYQLTKDEIEPVAAAQKKEI